MVPIGQSNDTGSHSPIVTLHLDVVITVPNPVLIHVYVANIGLYSRVVPLGAGGGSEEQPEQNIKQVFS